MNYETASDYEINKEVGVLRGFPEEWQTKLSSGFFVSSGGMHDDTLTGYDYCNNPGDMWPIIVENGISINYLPASDMWAASDSRGRGEIFYLHPSSLRAACIVYLKMQEQA